MRGLCVGVHIIILIFGSFQNHLGYCTRIVTYGIGGGERLAEQYKISFLGRIPIDPNFGFDLDNGRRYIDNFQRSATSKSIATVVDVVSVKIK